MSKIYTKTGDTGMTSLYDGQRISKTDLRLEALGDVDELNAYLGVCINKVENAIQIQSSVTHCAEDIKKEILHVQNTLFTIGASIATPTNEEKMSKVKFDEHEILELEYKIDLWTAQLQKLRNFIMPSGCGLHYSRAICRRAERHILRLDKIDPNIIIYMNRLSDYLFTIARVMDELVEHRAMQVWKKSYN